MSPSGKRKTSVLLAATLLVSLNAFLWRDRLPAIDEFFRWLVFTSRRARRNFAGLEGADQLLILALVILLALLIFRRIRRRIERRKPPLPPPLPLILRDYKRDIISGIKWVWDDVKAVEEGRLSAFCPSCSILLSKDTKKKDSQRFTVFSCSRCNRIFEPLEHDVPHAYQPIQDEIRRKVGSGEWKQTLKQPAAR